MSMPQHGNPPPKNPEALKGKFKKVALTAAMRKLIIILNTLVRTAQLWRGSVGG